MKNCIPELPAFTLPGWAGSSCRAADTALVMCLWELISSGIPAFRPPVPYCARWRGFLVSGSPPWMIPYLMAR